nr:uncharacterized protein LOC117834355 [Setaria viridis]
MRVKIASPVQMLVVQRRWRRRARQLRMGLKKLFWSPSRRGDMKQSVKLMSSEELLNLEANLVKKMSYSSMITRDRLAKSERSAAELAKKVASLEATIAAMSLEMKKVKVENAELKENSRRLGENYEARGDEIDRLSSEVVDLERQVKEKDRVIQDLREGAQRDSEIISGLKSKVGQMEPKLETREKLLSQIETTLRERFEKVHEVYKASLGVFGTEPDDCSLEEGCERMFEWLLDEVKSLAEVLEGLNDYSAAFFLESALHLLEQQGCEHVKNISEDNYVAPAASDIGCALKSFVVENAKKNLFERMWSTFGQQYVKKLACEQLAQLRSQPSAVNEEEDAAE